MHGMDVVLTGHEAQARPIGDEPLYKEGHYKGKGLNKPRGRAERRVDAPTIDELTLRAVCFRGEFEDVVLLREVHRVVRDDDEVVRNMTEEEKAEYMRQAKKFEGVTKRMSDLSWVAQDHAWLAGWRNRSALERTENGREELKAFDTAPLLMDAKKQKTGSDGGDGADDRYRSRLYRGLL